MKVETYDPQLQSVACTLAEYEYNGLHWRTMKRADRELRCLDPQQAAQQGIEHRAMYYDASWRLIEEHIKDRVGLFRHYSPGLGRWLERDPARIY